MGHARSFAALLDRFAASGLLGPRLIAAGEVRRRSCKRRPEEAPVPWPTVRPLLAARGGLFDGGDEARGGRDVDAVRADERLDESTAARLIVRPADGGFELRHMLLHGVRDAEDAAIDMRQVMEMERAFLRIAELRREHGGTARPTIALSISALVFRQRRRRWVNQWCNPTETCRREVLPSRGQTTTCGRSVSGAVFHCLKFCGWGRTSADLLQRRDKAQLGGSTGG